jgi:MarR family transcriptional regulator, transcriptional regulator for hemolysin
MSGTKLQRELIVRIISLAKSYRHCANEELEKSRLSHSAALIVTFLSHTNGDCSQKYLADQLDITGASLVPLLNQIEASGLIARHSNPEDKRVNRIALTAKGELLAEEAKRVLDGVRHKLFAGIDMGDIAAAVRTVEALQTAVSQHKKRV